VIRIIFASIITAAAIAALPYTSNAANVREAGGLAAIHKLGIEDGRLCMSDHPHYGQTGTWQTVDQAKASAIKSWSGFTRIEYGDDWAAFRLATDHKFYCSQAAGNRGRGWTCNVEARPCRR